MVIFVESGNCPKMLHTMVDGLTKCSTCNKMRTLQSTNDDESHFN